MVADFYALWPENGAVAAIAPPLPHQRPNGAAPHRYAAVALERECEDLAALPPDSRRNSTLNEAAFKMAMHIAAGTIDTDTVRAELTNAARRCGLPQPEIDLVLRDGGALAAGQQHPRPVPERPARSKAETVWWASIEPPTEDPVSEHDVPPTDQEDPAAATPEQPDEHTSWWPRDLDAILEGREPEQPPTHLTRDDGAPLFYPGAVNGLLGESESGKSWVALMLVAQRLNEGHLVVYLDFEDIAKNVVARLRMLGVDDTAIRESFRYIGPEEALHQLAAKDLQTTLAQQPDTVIVDGFNAAMTLLGLELESNVDVTKFFQSFLKPLTANLACVVYIDHVPKNKEQRGKGGIGAQAKRAMTSGSAFLVEIVKPFGRGMRGMLSLTIDKDRPGHIRGISNGPRAGIVHLDSTSSEGMVTMVIETPEIRETTAGTAASFRPTVLMQRVSQFLETVPDGASKKSVEEAVTGKAAGIRMALDCLVEEGFAVRETVGQTVLTKIVRAFRKDNDPTSSPSSPTSSPSSRDDAERTSSPSSPTPPSQGGDYGTRFRGAGPPPDTSSSSPIFDPHTGEIL